MTYSSLVLQSLHLCHHRNACNAESAHDWASTGDAYQSLSPVGVSKVMKKTATLLKYFLCGVASASLLSVGIAATAQAAAVISNGTIELGVDDFGQLNIPGSASAQGTPFVGLRFVPTNNDGTSPGCLCEGWGVADSLSGVAVFANNSAGNVGIGTSSFTSTPDSATAIVFDSSGTFKVTHEYVPDPATPFLYRTNVTVENIGSADVDLRYRRLMDWDIEPTAFSEFVTIQGTATASNVLFASNNGFANSNPLSGPSSIAGLTGDFVDQGPLDHGALFDFGFGTLAPGSSFSFTTFYGAAPNRDEAIAALGAVGAEVFSLARANNGDLSGAPNTFIFGFKGVGGVPVIPTPALVPGVIAFGLGVLRKRKDSAVESQDEV